MDYSGLVQKQRRYFATGVTRPLKFRLAALNELKIAVEKHEDDIVAALKTDLDKSAFETFISENILVLSEIKYHLKHLHSWIKPRRLPTPTMLFRAKVRVESEPYGVSLIMSPWNYPFQLCLAPLVGAISAGNCALVKPSAYAPHASELIKKIITEIFSEEYIHVVEGGRDENNALLAQKFDYIFFTGSANVGKTVMKAASAHLTPVTLELGGKSPVIVDQTADLLIAARRIAFGKVLNAGQTCVAPDYLLIHESIKERFIEAYQQALDMFFPDKNISDMSVIINDKHFQRICRLVEGQKVAIGGNKDATSRFFEPTLLVDTNPDDAIMQEEIFAPILPMITYKDISECITFINSRPKPLALYLFTKDKNTENKILQSCSFGGGCINDTIMHLTVPTLGFGGVGESGMGSYHGKHSFDTFTHYKSIVSKYNWPDMKLRYRPYNEKKLNLLRKLAK